MRVEFSEGANAELDALLENLAYYHSEETSERVQTAIYRRVDALTSFPHQYESFFSKKYGAVRRMVVLNKTIILYRVDRDVITILSVFDARTDWK